MSKFLDDINEFCKENTQNIFRVAIIEGDGEPEQTVLHKMRCMNSYSVAKAFTVAAIGMLYDDKKLRLEDKVTEILKDEIPEGMDPRWNKVSIEDAIKHRIGLSGAFLDIDQNDPITFTNDYLKYMLTYPLMHEPGEESHYTDGAYYLLSRIVEKISGEPLDTFLWKRLFWPLAFKEVAWSRCPMGHPMVATGLYIRSDDMVKLGAVYLNKGMWKGQRILSEEWVNIVFEKGYEMAPKGVEGVYGKGGMLGQNLLVIPQKNLAVAWHGHHARGEKALINFIANYDMEANRE
jgi:CubicO group peptidase (beta-lactamase class C family)